MGPQIGLISSRKHVRCAQHNVTHNTIGIWELLNQILDLRFGPVTIVYSISIFLLSTPSQTTFKNRYWIFGAVYCTLNNFISYLSVSSSVFTLLAISVDRRKAIVRPLAPKSGRACVILTILLIWTGSAALASPAALFSVTVPAMRWEMLFVFFIQKLL